MTSLASSATSRVPATWVEGAVRQAIAGDEVAFARIVDAYHGDLVRVAYVVTGDVQSAQDAAQAAWSIAWRKLGSLRDPERVRPWLVSVAANEARQIIRRQHRQQVAEIKLGPQGDALRDPSADVDRLDLLDAVRRLKAEDRSLLALRYVAGLDSNEIGTFVGMSPSGVRGHLSRLLRRLRRELHDG
ncbi:MAG: sigma-70 family RNA polymerase sigma factor [Chloroflexota bacterium]|nr:sigma-70 family RNA polymerase sigma factor [Chloroflexota bacterium]